MAILAAPVCVGAAAELPDGVRAVWDLGKAFREKTGTRERVSINGLWRWQPAGEGDAIPADGWGFLRVPEAWPGGSREWGTTTFFPHAEWAGRKDLGNVTAAWQEREITIPREWEGRRITLAAPYLNSYAVVYVDGKRAGEMRYPAGESELTAWCHPGQTHVVSMLVMALPLKAVMMAFNDTASARQVAGKVLRRGCCGDMWLESTPAGARIADVKVETSVRRWQITVDAALAGLAADGRYRLRATVRGGPQFTSKPFGAAELADGRIAITEHWRPERLWDTDSPEQYELRVELLDGRAAAIDEALPVRFGFREFWIDGRDFYLNGTRIYLSATPLDNGQLGAVAASYEATRATLQRYKSFGINFVYTHNYGCEPGSHLSFEEVLRAADDEGMLVSFSQPHFGHYEWTSPENGYREHAEFYARVAQNHASVICYSTSHNSTGYSEDMNPDMIDGIQNPRDSWALKNASLAMRAEEIIRRIDGSRFVYHHASGNLGVMHTSNFYANWAPAQEISDWFEHWATAGVKPLFTCEYSVPFLWDWAMYRGWYQGKREFGSAAAPWEFCVAEWDAQFLGERSYDIGEAERVNLRWEAAQFRKGRNGWMRWDYPESLNSAVFDDRFEVIAAYLTDNFRAFRTWGVSATSPWEYGNYWKPAIYERALHLDLAIDWEGLQRPGARPAYLDERAAKDRLAFRAADAVPTAAAKALYRNNRPLLAYLAGKPAAFTSKDHLFVAGETVDKQVVAINNSRKPVGGECEWTLGLPRPVSGSAQFMLAAGRQARIPLKVVLPSDLAAGRYELRARVVFTGGETQEDVLGIDVMAPAPGPRAEAKIALYDPKGDTGRVLRAAGVASTPVTAAADLAAYDLLIVGKGALTAADTGPDLAGVRDGLKVVVFEQTGEVLEKRFGFRVAEYGMRRVFARVPGHALLAGVGEEHLRDWRGSATTLPPRLAYERTAKFNYAPTVQWSGIPVTRLWRCGNRGNVASAVIEKPACGDFLPVVDCGYALQYTPLVEHREGSGMTLFCQMDVSGRTERDPAAETIARNVLAHAASWKAGVRRRVAYAGDPAGRQYLEAAGIVVSGEGELLVAGPGAGRAAAQWQGPVLAIGFGAEDAAALGVTVRHAEHIAAYFPAFDAGSVFAGVSPAEVHNRDPRVMALVGAGAEIAGDGVLARKGNVVMSQLAPWGMDYTGGKMNVKRTFRRVACLTARLLGNLGAGGSGRRYLDEPEEWDDPYRFFRW